MSHFKEGFNNCFRCGSENFITKNGNYYYCQDCSLNFYRNSASAAAAVIVNKNNEILLTIRGIEPHKGKLDLPGGFVDPGESLEQAVVREVKEELNLEVKSIKYIGSAPNTYFYSGITVFTTDVGFFCEVEGYENIKPQDDISGYMFYKPDEIPFQEMSSNSITKIIELFLEKKSKGEFS